MKSSEDCQGVMFPDGVRRWVVDGCLHREDGPAVIREDGAEFWYLHGRRHRVDGPAVISTNGKHEEWYFHGEFHRVNGPAFILPDGSNRWYISGKRIIERKVYQRLARLSDEEMTLLILKYGDI